MAMDPNKQVLRLQKRHEPDPLEQPDPEVGKRLEAAQSVRNAITASLIVIILFTAIWAMLSVALNRFFPWLTVLLGMVLGLAVRRAGLGLDWRFPLIAGVMATIGGGVGNVVIAAMFTAGEMGTTTMAILKEVPTMGWSVFFVDAMNPADVIFSLSGGAIAAFYSMRRLTRRQYLAFRLWKQSERH